jgi:glycosyltransferase involved in cell wall biosynthesis
VIKSKFTFAILTFNHEAYIIEHLESIRFLIENFGSAYEFNLIVADDGSRDQTVTLASRWLSIHDKLFTDIKILADGTNKGTCLNYTRIWPLIEGERFKITAGDDVYACTNIFEEVEQLKHHDFFSGLPLLLIDGKILESKSTIFHILATEVIYQGKKFFERLKGVSSINTPSLFYNKKFLKDKELSSFINSHSVTEDFPMMVKIANSYQDISFTQSKKVYIYYRRTSGSTYLIRGSDFDLDKLKVFSYMLSCEKTWLGKYLLRNRIYCYKIDNSSLKKLLNISYYTYLFKIAANLLPLLKTYSTSVPEPEPHQEHYNLIVRRAKMFYKDCISHDGHIVDSCSRTKNK